MSARIFPMGGPEEMPTGAGAPTQPGYPTQPPPPWQYQPPGIGPQGPPRDPPPPTPRTPTSSPRPSQGSASPPAPGTSLGRFLGSPLGWVVIGVGIVSLLALMTGDLPKLFRRFR